MTNIARMNGFENFGNHVWLNTAHQGALPTSAAQEAQEAIGWKTAPFALTQERFKDVPSRLRRTLGHLIGAPDDQIVLTNSASYGLHLIAHAYPWHAGDEIIVADNDFPADIFPWLLCEKRYNVKVIRVHPTNQVISPEELESAITRKTRLLCTTWVHSFSGCVADIASLGNICRNKGITFVVNASQAIGARPFKLADFPVDVVTCVGFKWLCGPYGTGFCWINPQLLRHLNPFKAYWQTLRTSDDLGQTQASLQLPTTVTARNYDIFGTANFWNFKPWAAAVEWLLQLGIERIARHDQDLIERLLANIDDRRYTLVSPREIARGRSTLVVITHNNPSNNPTIMTNLARHNVHVAMRAGALRISPHLYSSSEDIDIILDILNSFHP